MFYRDTFTDTSSPPPNGVLEWDMRTGGMFGQKDDVGDDDHSDGRMISITVFHDTSQHELYLPAESTFGDVKRLLVHKTGLNPEEQVLFFRGYERQNEEHLRLEGVKNKSQMYVFESAFNQVRKLEQSRNQHVMLKASEAVAGVRTEVDKLSERLAVLEVAVSGGTKVAENEFVMLTELLMRQLLKLDTIEAEGEARLQRKAEVCRVQNLVDTLDSLKESNSKPSSNNGNAISVTTGEPFPSGMGRPLGQFDCSENREFKLPHIEQSLDLNTGRALARKRVKHSVGPLGAQVQFEQRVENKTAPLEDPQSSHQREPKEGIERVATPGARELEDTIALAQPVVHINERITTKDAQAQTEGEIVKEVVRPEMPELSKQIETGIDDVEIGDGDVANVIPQVLAQTEETTRELPTGGEVPTPTNPPAEIVHKNFFPPISEPMQLAVPILKVPPAEIAPKNFSPILAPMQGRVVPTATGSPAEITRENFFTPILQPTQVGNVGERSSAQTSSNKHPMGDRPQEASSQEVEVPSGEYHSLTFAQHPIAGGSSSKVESVIGCPVVGHQGLYHPPVFYSPPLEEATHVNVGEILKLISPSSIIPTSQSPVDPLATTGAPVSAARNVARSVAELCGLDDKATKLMETAFNKYPNLMIIRSDRRKTFIRWMFCSLSDLLQLLSTASTGTLDVLKISEIEDVLRELETFGFDAGFIFEMRLQVREARFAVDNATFDLKALCTKAEGLNLEIEIMESNIAAAKAEVARVEAKINTLCDFVEENRNPVFKWIQQN